jgi:deazaflavin-dependent oxidoreductase (nitroreductase family)
MSQFRPGLFLRIGNRITTPLIRLGLPMGPMALLTVAGRRSGLPRTTPVAVAPLDEGWRLVAAYGIVDWVHNLRAAGKAELSRRGKTIPVSAIELGPSEAAPLLRDSLLEVNPMVRGLLAKYFDTDVDAPLSDWAAETVNHPVFRLSPIE